MNWKGEYFHLTRMFKLPEVLLERSSRIISSVLCLLLSSVMAPSKASYSQLLICVGEEERIRRRKEKEAEITAVSESDPPKKG